MYLKDERSKLTLALSIVTIGLLSFALISPWWIVEESTGRQTAPDGPQDESETRVDRAQADFYVDGYRGDLEPANAAAANLALGLIGAGVYVAIVATALLVIGEMPWIWQFITRRVGIVLAVVGLVGISSSLMLAWLVLPLSMLSQGISGPFTSSLLDEGYIRSHLYLGWAATAFAWASMFAAGLAKFGAGNDDPAVIEEFRVAA